MKSNFTIHSLFFFKILIAINPHFNGKNTIKPSFYHKTKGFFILVIEIFWIDQLHIWMVSDQHDNFSQFRQQLLLHELLVVLAQLLLEARTYVLDYFK